MTTFLTDSMARDHAMTMQADARASRRARAARAASRDARRAQRSTEQAEAGSRANHGVGAVGHAAARPLVAVRHWWVAGQL